MLILKLLKTDFLILEIVISKRLEIIEKLYASKTFLKMAGGKMHTPYPPPLPRIRPWPMAISCRNHQKSLACFSHLALLLCFFFFTKRRSQNGRGMAQCPPPPLNTLLQTTLPVFAVIDFFGAKAIAPELF